MKKLKINDTMKPYIKNVVPFRFLQDDELDQLIAESEVFQYQDEEFIIQQGEIDQSLFAILKGCVKITVDNESDTAYICTIGSSEIFGEAGIFLNLERTANVISMEDAVIFKIKRENLMTFIKKNPIASNKILMIIIYSLLKKLKEANRELAYERKSDCNQNDIDDLISSLIG